MKKILHIITSIGSGGAERVLYNLISGEKKNKHLIISLSSPKSNFHDFNNEIFEIGEMIESKSNENCELVFTSISSA